MAKFISIEGVEGLGKSTAMQTVLDALAQRDIRAITTREPGGTPLAESIRGLLLGEHAEPVAPEAEALLMFAARAQHIQEVIRPALAQGTWVLSDRFVDASYAYQSGGRGVDVKRLDYLADWVVGDCQPDLVLLLDAPWEVSLARMQHRDEQKDRFEQEPDAFFERVRAAYLARAKQEPERIQLIDASGSIGEVQAQILQKVEALIAC